jgi:hypothetical protein
MNMRLVPCMKRFLILMHKQLHDAGKREKGRPVGYDGLISLVS